MPLKYFVMHYQQATTQHQTRCQCLYQSFKWFINFFGKTFFQHQEQNGFCGSNFLCVKPHPLIINWGKDKWWLDVAASIVGEYSSKWYTVLVKLIQGCEESLGINDSTFFRTAINSRHDAPNRWTFSSSILACGMRKTHHSIHCKKQTWAEQISSYQLWVVTRPKSLMIGRSLTHVEHLAHAIVIK